MVVRAQGGGFSDHGFEALRRLCGSDVVVLGLKPGDEVVQFAGQDLHHALQRRPSRIGQSGAEPGEQVVREIQGE